LKTTTTQPGKSIHLGLYFSFSFFTNIDPPVYEKINKVQLQYPSLV